MGFDNECILNIESLSGEYFCPVCRLLVYPSEALQSRCTHLYCKPCLTYILSTSRACPYDGYLVTEADSKPLIESNKQLAETIGKIAVHCLYHQSGCSWQGQLSECTTHCNECAFGNYPIVCNKCGTQIVHRQVQQHSQNCLGVQPQGQQTSGGQNAMIAPGMIVAGEQNHVSQAQSIQIATPVPPSQDQSQENINSKPQAAAQSVPTSEQWYQQQQHYQQYPGYEPYQQHYLPYDPYKLHANLQYQQHIQTNSPHVIQVTNQSQPQPQPHPQMQPQTHPPSQGNQRPQLHIQARPHPPQLQVQPHSQQRPHVPQHQQPLPQVQLPQPHPLCQPQLHPQPLLQHPPYMQPQPQPHFRGQNQSYPQPQPLQQMLPGAPQQIPGQFPQLLPQMCPPQSHVPTHLPQGMPPAQQQPVHVHSHQPGQPIDQYPDMHPPQQPPIPQLPIHGHLYHPHSFPGQTTGLVHNQAHQYGNFMQPQLRPQGPPESLLQNVPLTHGMPPHQSQNHAGRPMMPNHGVSHQPFQQASGGPAHGKLIQSSAIQPLLNQNYPTRMNIRPQSTSDQQLGYVQQSALPQSGSGTVLQPSLSVLSSEKKIQASSIETTMISELEADSKEANGLLSTPSRGADSIEFKIPTSESDFKSLFDEGMSVNENEGKSNRPNFHVKGISESSQAQGDESEESVIKQMVKKEATSKLEPSTSEITAKDRGDFPHCGPKQDGNSLKEDKEIQVHPLQETVVLEGKDVKMQTDMADSHMAHSGLDAGGPMKPFPRADRVSQAVSQSIGQMQGNNFVQPGHSVPDNQQLPMHYVPPPQMQDRAHQTPFIRDWMLQPPMPPPHAMQVPGEPHVHLRPHGHNLHGTLPPQGQPPIISEHFRPPISKQHHQGSFHPEVPPGGFIGVGSLASFRRGPTLLGPSHRGFEPQSSGPQGHYLQGHVPSAHAIGPRIRSECGLHHGSFDSHGGMIAREPPHGSEGHIDEPRPTNPMDAEMFANKRPSSFDGGQTFSHVPGYAEHVPFGQSSVMQSNIRVMSGGPGKGFAGGIRDPSFPIGLQEERFKPLPEESNKQLREEGFNPLQGERFKSFSIERSRHIIDQRESEEDLKQFPRPAHLVDAEPMPRFGSYFSSSKSLDRAPHGFGRLPLSRSPGREYSDIPSSRFGRPEDIDGKESRVFGERSKPFIPSSDGNSFNENIFPVLPNHLRRDELGSPGNLRISEEIGSSAPPIHLRVGEMGGCRHPIFASA